MLWLFKILLLVSVGVIVFKWRSLPLIGKSIRQTFLAFKSGLKDELPPLKDVTPKNEETESAEPKKS